VSALVYDAGTVLVPGVVLGVAPGTRHHRPRVLVRRSAGTFHTEEYRRPGERPPAASADIGLVTAVS